MNGRNGITMFMIIDGAGERREPEQLPRLSPPSSPPPPRWLLHDNPLKQLL